MNPKDMKAGEFYRICFYVDKKQSGIWRCKLVEKVWDKKDKRWCYLLYLPRWNGGSPNGGSPIGIYLDDLKKIGKENRVNVRIAKATKKDLREMMVDGI